jgi:hypothetical protein
MPEVSGCPSIDKELPYDSGLLVASGDSTDIVYPNNTYRTLRVIEENDNWAYTVWCTGERELFDMKVSRSSISKHVLTD